MKFHHERLESLVHSIFTAAGFTDEEAHSISHHLVESNLAGHDSHGVIRVSTYIRWLNEGMLKKGSDVEMIVDSDVLALIDGQFRFGQVLGERIVRMGLEKADRFGVGIIALRRGGHVGRVGHWAEMIASAGKIALCFVNTSGLGMLVAPFGGIDRRLSANPIAAGLPVPGSDPIVMDISTSTIAEGKLQVARNKGVPVPDGMIINNAGEPTNEPADFYDPPVGALLSFGGHKGYALGLVAEVLGGALTGNHCSREGEEQFSQGMLTIVIDPARFASEDFYSSDLKRYLEFVKSSRTVTPNGEILLPGEPERRTRAQRRKDGVELDNNTWSGLVSVAQELNVPAATIEAAPLD